jgi:dTDP-4-dehydrorhamnose reductase
MKNIMVLGANGQLGSEFKEYNDILGYKDKEYKWYFFNKQEIDITKLIICELKPDIIINCAAYTNVNKAENEDFLINQEINNLALVNIIDFANENNAQLIHFSTDYVFSGDCESDHEENFTPLPVNKYGEEKHYGEEKIKMFCNNYKIIRFGYLYSQYKNNMILSFIKKLKNEKEIKAIYDSFFNVTFTKDLVDFVIAVINSEDCENEIIHFSNGEILSPYGIFLILKTIYGFNTEIIPINYDCFYKCNNINNNVERPKNSILSNKLATRKYSIFKTSFANNIRQYFYFDEK